MPGSLVGGWDGELGGVSGTSRFNATWASDPGDMVLTVSDATWSCVGGVHAIASASGSGTAVARPGSEYGDWYVVGETFPRGVVGVSAAFSFELVRTQAGVRLDITASSLTLDVAGLGRQVVVTGPQRAAGHFVVESSSGPCGAPSDNQVSLAGVITLVQP